MNALTTFSRHAMTGSIPFVGHRLSDKLRFVAGAGINVIGAGVLLAEAIRFASLTT